MTSTSSPFDDSPLMDLEDDRLGRSTDVARLVRAVERIMGQEESSVIGVVGRWGSGKTSVVNAAMSRLSTDIRVAYFNPWSYSTPDAALVGFTRSIQEIFKDDKNPRMKRSREAFGRFLLGHSSWGSMAGFAGADMQGVVADVGKWMAGDMSLYDQRSEVVEALREYGMPIIVIVDDVDRLEPDELMTTFRLVRQLGRLPFIHYVMCFDETTLLDVIKQTGLAGDNDARAREYLEKLVQAQVTISTPSNTRLIAVLTATLQEFCALHGTEFGWSQRERVIRAWDGGLVFYLDRPRNIKRLMAQLSIVWPDLSGSVDFVDLCFILVLHMFEPQFLAKCRREPRSLLLHSRHAESSLVEEMSGTTVAASRPTLLDKAIKTSSEPTVVRNLLVVLNESVSTAQRKNAFCDPWHLEKYLLLQQSSLDHLDRSLIDAIDALRRHSLAEFKHFWVTVDAGTSEVLHGIELLDALEPIGTEGMVMLINSLAQRLSESEEADEVRQIESGSLVAAAISTLNNLTANDAVASVEELASNPFGVVVPLNLLAYGSVRFAHYDACWASVVSNGSSLFQNPAFFEVDGESAPQQAIMNELANRTDSITFLKLIAQMLEVRDAVPDPFMFAVWVKGVHEPVDLPALFALSARLKEWVDGAKRSSACNTEIKHLLRWSDGVALVQRLVEEKKIALATVVESMDFSGDEFGSWVQLRVWREVGESLMDDEDFRWLPLVRAMCIHGEKYDVATRMWQIAASRPGLNVYSIANHIYCDGDGGDGIFVLELALGLDRVAQWLRERPESLQCARDRGATSQGKMDLIHLLDDAYGLAGVEANP